MPLPTRRRLIVKLWGLGVGLILLFWLPVESGNPYVLLGLAAAGSLWLSAYLRSRHAHIPLFISGLLAGALTAPAAVALAVLKTGVHAHGNAADFSPQLLAAILQQTPWFALGGLLTGAACQLWPGNNA
ncbi:MAG: hypothetical protein D6803_07435 [Anaerolineae bacterium]|nr:MAG: hypothetical protein D6803_07435 [Anaerolineae bacterium]